MKARQQAALARRDMAKAGQAQAQAALSQARTSLDYTRIRAPFDGVVTEKKADSGTLASARHADLHRRGRAPLSTGGHRQRERSAVRANRTSRCRSSIDALDNAGLKGKVVQIVPAADAASRTFPGEDRIAHRHTAAFGAVRAGPVFSWRAAGAVDSAFGGRRTRPIAGHLCAGPKQGCELALHHIGKAFRGRGRSAGGPPGRRAACGQTGCSRPERQAHRGPVMADSKSKSVIQPPQGLAPGRSHCPQFH